MSKKWVRKVWLEDGPGDDHVKMSGGWIEVEVGDAVDGCQHINGLVNTELNSTRPLMDRFIEFDMWSVQCRACGMILFTGTWNECAGYHRKRG